MNQLEGNAVSSEVKVSNKFSYHQWRESYAVLLAYITRNDSLRKNIKSTNQLVVAQVYEKIKGSCYIGPLMICNISINCE